MQPLFPVFVPTLSRYDTRYTIKALQRMNIERWFAVVEPQEHDLYAAVVPAKHILVLDMSYKDRYETCDEFGRTKSTGSGPARNFIWDTAIKMGYSHQWTIDDNITRFMRANNNLRYEVLDGSFFRAMEEFALRYENLGMSGPNYEMFAPRKAKQPPFVLNTRIYSCNLIRTDVPFRWRGRFNEDTILSLDMLKAGWCTALFNSFQQKKLTTMSVKGGNTNSLYLPEGTYAKSKLLADVHPDVARVTHRFGRDHHYVDYKPFRHNRLKRKAGIVIPTEPNDMGMKLLEVT